MQKRSCVDVLKQYLPPWGRYVKDTRNSTDFVPGVGIICLEDLLHVAAVTEQQSGMATALYLFCQRAAPDTSGSAKDMNLVSSYQGNYKHMKIITVKL